MLAAPGQARITRLVPTHGGFVKGNNHYGLGGIEGVGKYLKDYSTLLTGGLTGNLAVTYLGSYYVHYNVIGIDHECRTATVNFVVTNPSSIASATRPPVIGYWKIWKDNIGDPLNNMLKDGPMSKTNQEFYWTEQIKW